jgi:hypothetical protein
MIPGYVQELLLALNDDHRRQPTIEVVVHRCLHGGEVAVYVEATGEHPGALFLVLGRGATTDDAVADGEGHVFALLGDDATVLDWRPA